MYRSGVVLDPVTNRVIDQLPLGGLELHHVGIVVRDLKKAIAHYRLLGFGEPIEADLPDQGVRVATFSAGSGYLELLMPIAEETGVTRFLESRGEGMHHMALKVRDLESELRRLESAGLELIDKHPRTGAHGWLVAFIHPRSCGGVLTELVQV
jgi:methylmalonyl-CoA/ethylmalonyl-CoA epimerase